MVTTSNEIDGRNVVGHHKRFGPTNEQGTCLWCGSPLKPQYRLHDYSKIHKLAAQLCTEAGEDDLDCTARRYGDSCNHHHLSSGALGGCEHHYRVAKLQLHEATGRLGQYEDNAFCGLRCGYMFGLTLARLGKRLEAKS